jgi:hypothetical protein
MEEEAAVKRARKAADAAFMALLREHTPAEAASVTPRACQLAVQGRGAACAAAAPVLAVRLGLLPDAGVMRHHESRCMSRVCARCCARPAGTPSPGSARVAASKVSITQDSSFEGVEAVLGEDPAWQVRGQVVRVCACGWVGAWVRGCVCVCVCVCAWPRALVPREVAFPVAPLRARHMMRASGRPHCVWMCDHSHQQTHAHARVSRRVWRRPSTAASCWRPTRWRWRRWRSSVRPRRRPSCWRCWPSSTWAQRAAGTRCVLL